MSLLPWVRVLRLPLVGTAVGDSLACGALAWTASGRSLGDLDPLAVLALAGTSALLYVVGMGANDWADRHRDRTLAPDRPLPSGQLSPTAVLAVVLLALAGALVLGGGSGGHRGAVVAAAGLALGYDLWLKRWWIPGALSMGGVRFANASVAVWPLALRGDVPIWVLGAPAAIGLYSASILVLSTAEETGQPERRVLVRVLTCVAFAGAAVVAWAVAGHVVLGALLAGGVILSTATGRTPRAATLRLQVLEMLLGLFFLQAVVASGVAGGDPAVAAGVLVAAFLAIYGSWRWIKAVAIRAARVPVNAAPDAP